MTVEAVNGVDQQQRIQHSAAATVGTGLALGGLGYLGGYLATNKRPNLDEVFAMKNDEFVNATKDTEGKVKEAADKIAKARTEYADAGVAERNDWYKAMMKKHEFTIDETKVKPDNLDALKNDVTNAKAKFDEKVKANVDGKDIEMSYTEAEDAVKSKRGELSKAKAMAEGTDAEKAAKNTAIENAKKELAAAQKERKAIYEAGKANIDPYVDAEAKLHNARIDKVNSMKGEAGEAKNLYDGMKAAQTKYENAKSNKLSEIKGRDEIKQAYEEIKSLFKKKYNAKTAWIAAAAAAVVGLFAGYFLSAKPVDAPQETQA